MAIITRNDMIGELIGDLTKIQDGLQLAMEAGQDISVLKPISDKHNQELLRTISLHAKRVKTLTESILAIPPANDEGSI